MYGLEKLGFVDQNWLERNLSSLLLRTLVVGRRRQSESNEVVEWASNRVISEVVLDGAGAVAL